MYQKKTNSESRFEKRFRRITQYSSSGSFEAWVCEVDFEEAFPQTTPSGFMNTGTLSATA
jgi:hypothetical protein